MRRIKGTEILIPLIFELRTANIPKEGAPFEIKFKFTDRPEPERPERTNTSIADDPTLLGLPKPRGK
jgi:hypothetical protein